uniref:Secreted protein n=1 Tax=Arundo donax TaxID=35708 RepID=A0A0A9GCK8_ARUDO
MHILMLNILGISLHLLQRCTLNILAAFSLVHGELNLQQVCHADSCHHVVQHPFHWGQTGASVLHIVHD